MLMRRLVLAPDGEQVLLQQIENVRRYFHSPLLDLFFVPMSIESKRRVRQILGKRLAITPFAGEHLAELASGVHFVDAPGGIAAVIDKCQQHSGR